MKKILKLSRPQDQIDDVKSRKIGHFGFFQPSLNLPENWLLATCSTHMSSIHRQLLKLSRPQGQIINVNCEKLQ